MLRDALMTRTALALAVALGICLAVPSTADAASPGERQGQTLLGGLLRQLINPAPAADAADTTGTLTTEDALARAREIGGDEGFREATGQGASPEIMDDPDALRELLGENPRWVWHIDPNQARPDPMLIPWVAEKLLIEARDAEARALEGVGQLEEALEIYLDLLDTLSDPDYRLMIEARVAQLTERIEQSRMMAAQPAQPGETPATQQVVEPVLPQYVIAETRGIIYDPLGGSIVAVGDQSLGVGEEVEGFPGVVVKSIGYQTAVFSVTNEFMTKDFAVQVQGDLVEVQ